MTVTNFAASGDTHIDRGAATTNYGSNAVIAIEDDGTEEFVGLIRFDVSTIPPYATVDTATLRLNRAIGGGTGGTTHNLYRVVRQWLEAQATWNEATTGDNWGTAGAKNTTSDYNSGTLVTIGFPTAAQGQGFAATADVTTWAQAWIDQSNPNYGIVIRPTVSDGVSYQWASRDSATAAWRPNLAVAWTVHHAIDGNAMKYISFADWPDLIIAESLGQIAVRARFMQHVWRAPIMPMADWQIIVDLQGESVPIRTTNPEDRNGDLVEFFEARVDRVEGQHLGPNMQNVTIEFTVKT